MNAVFVTSSKIGAIEAFLKTSGNIPELKQLLKICARIGGKQFRLTRFNSCKKEFKCKLGAIFEIKVQSKLTIDSDKRILFCSDLSRNFQLFPDWYLKY